MKNALPPGKHPRNRSRRRLAKSQEKERDEAEDKLKTSEDSATALEKENNALLALYTLQQEYLTGNLDGCRLTLQEFSDQKLDELLPDTAPEGVTTPAQRYLELKEAILNHQ